MKLTVLDNQSLFDLAVQALGGAEAAFSLALENDLPITEELTAGQIIIAVGTQNKAIADYYENKQLKPATGITDDEWNNVWDGTFDDTFGNNNRIFDFTFDLTFE